MAFDKTYFEHFDEQLKKYSDVFSSVQLTVTLKVMNNTEFLVNRFLDCGDELLTFAYYDTKKQIELSKRVREERGEPTGFPAVAVPYSAIIWVELNPGIAPGAKGETGFRPQQSQNN